MIKKVGFLGPTGSFSELAAKNVFPNEELVAKDSIIKVFSGVEKKNLDYGVVPIENSTGGSVAFTLDELIQKDVFIACEHYLKINYCFLSNSEKQNVKKIFSHSQGFLQCRNWIEKNFPDVQLIECSSNSKAAELASKENDCGALATKEASGIFGLKLVEEMVNDHKENETRFVVISLEQNDPVGKEKTSCIVSLKNKPGALLDTLIPLKENNINMTNIESRPAKKGWEYLFYIDLVGNIEQENIKKALEKMKLSTEKIKLLGSYSKK